MATVYTGSPMPRSAFVGVDIGTSSCKGVLLAETGEELGTALHEYAPKYGPDGEVTQDPGDWLEALRRVLTVLGQRAAEQAVRVEAIAPTAPAHAVVLLDEAGRPLDRSILPYDTRSSGTADRLYRRLGIEMFERTYVRVGPSWTLPQLQWLVSHEPAYWPRLRHVLPTKDFAGYALTGQVATDATDAAGTGLFDHTAGDWAEEFLQEARLQIHQMPPVRPSDSVLGGLVAEWASATGLRADTPVVVGCTDTAAELLSLSAVSAGRGLVKIASTGTVVTVTDAPHPDPRTLTYPHCVAGLWYSLAATNSAATAYQWLRRMAFADNEGGFAASYREMDDVASTAPPGSGGLLFMPFLTGERSPYWDGDLRAAFLGLSAAHGRPHLSRAVLEGIAFSLRDCRDMLAEMGLAPRTPFFTGGGLASELWRTILASVLRTDGVLASPHGPSVGAAVLAAAGVGCRVPVARSTSVVRPNPEWEDGYERYYAEYRRAVRATRGLSHRLARLARDRR